VEEPNSVRDLFLKSPERRPRARSCGVCGTTPISRGTYVVRRIPFDESRRYWLFQLAREHFHKADRLLSQFRTPSGGTDLPRLAHTLLDECACEAFDIKPLTRQVLVLAAMIELHRQRTKCAPIRVEALERMERELMEMSSKSFHNLSPRFDAMEVAFSFMGSSSNAVIPLSGLSGLLTRCAGEHTRWAIKNAPLRGDPLIRHYIRKWEFRWRRFLPGNQPAANSLGTGWLRKAAEAGRAVAQRELAKCYASGDGVERNDKLAALWFRKAAQQGDAVAENLFGCYCDQGRGVLRDPAEAVKWYRASAEAGYAPAQYNLGCCCYGGMGVKQDYPEAAKWFLRGAEQGLPEAQSSLGLCYLEGHGVPQDYAQAINYYQKAAERGYDVAKYNLACCYFDGLGVSQDYVEALKWLSLISAGQMSAQVPAHSSCDANFFDYCRSSSEQRHYVEPRPLGNAEARGSNQTLSLLEVLLFSRAFRREA